MGYFTKINGFEQVVKNKWNFYGLVFKDTQGNKYNIPRISILLWPTSIKNIVTSTVFVPKLTLLKVNYYLHREEWLNERAKLYSHHSAKEQKLFGALWKREQGICFLCKESLDFSLSEFSSDIEIHHIIPFSLFTKRSEANKFENLALVHGYCHGNWHTEPENKIVPRSKTR